MKMAVSVLQFLIFPGFLFTAAIGLLASWIDRKVTARVQYRVGPPWYQPLADIVKLLGKETLMPAGSSQLLFFTAPLIGLAGVTLVSMILWLSNLDPAGGFIGDIIVVLYLLTLPALSLILGGFASNNSYASLGASREMKLVLSYELPFILALAVPIIKSGGILTIGGILNYQAANGIVVGSFSGSIALIVAILCMQAKLGLVPFDVSEAETELMGGPIIEYSGGPLAVFKLTKAMLLFTMPMFLIVAFMGGISVSGLSLLWGILKYVALLVVIVLIRNTNPRLRIDQALRFFWGRVTVLAVIGVVLALFGL
ncbi:MAG: NADH-quinone oxidoreductase subunit H [Candidatus Omnitrophica bacterium]|nr:NADH-quinone oxidoreductase subunit H [Candidatus Omnitrophota bacterium]